MVQSKNIMRIAIVTASLLLVPLVAMQFTDEVVWDLLDFVIAGALLFGAGLAYELVARRGATTAYRAAVGIAVATGLFLIWMNLAVGLIGSEDNPANLLYIGVLVVGIAGAFFARFQPHGMARALFAVAVVQVLVPVIALIIWRPEVNSAEDRMGMLGIFVLNGFFAALFVGSALLFQKAARGELERGAA